MANEDENNCTNVPTNQKSSWSSFLKSIATFSGDLSSLTAPSFILSPTSLCEFPSYWVCCNLKKKRKKNKQRKKNPAEFSLPLNTHSFCFNISIFNLKIKIKFPLFHPIFKSISKDPTQTKQIQNERTTI